MREGNGTFHKNVTLNFDSHCSIKAIRLTDQILINEVGHSLVISEVEVGFRGRSNSAPDTQLIT